MSDVRTQRAHSELLNVKNNLKLNMTKSFQLSHQLCEAASVHCQYANMTVYYAITTLSIRLYPEEI